MKKRFPAAEKVDHVICVVSIFAVFQAYALFRVFACAEIVVFGYLAIIILFGFLFERGYRRRRSNGRRWPKAAANADNPPFAQCSTDQVGGLRFPGGRKAGGAFFVRSLRLLSMRRFLPRRAEKKSFYRQDHHN
jgi:hypothetical protein